jgi:hypothetical protein
MFVYTQDDIYPFSFSGYTVVFLDVVNFDLMCMLHDAHRTRSRRKCCAHLPRAPRGVTFGPLYNLLIK